MKKILFGLTFLVVLFSVFSCTQSCPDDRMEPTPPPAPEKIFKLSNTNLDFDARVGENIIKLTSTEDWTATPNVDWITVTPSQAKGDNKEVDLVVKVTENRSFEPRSGEIKILDKTITINQEAMKPSIILHTTQKEGGDVTLQMYSSIDKDAIVDWGDGSKLDTLSLAALNGDEKNAKKYKGEVVKHPMKKTDVDIKIYSYNIEGFKAPASWLTKVDVSNALEMKNISLEHNHDMTSLDLSNLKKLISIYVWDNRGLKDLLLSPEMPDLTTLECYKTAIKTLDISKYPNIKELSCENNPNLKLTFGEKNVNLKSVWFYNNAYDVATMTEMLKMLPTVEGATIYPVTTSKPDNVNDINGVDFTIATKKGWKVIEHGSKRVIAQP